MLTCINKMSEELKDLIYVYIDNRSVMCRGVVTDWPFSIQELWDALDKEGIVQMERMKREIYDKEKKTIREVEIDNIVSIRDIKLQDRLYDGIDVLRVRPFVEAVKQCYKCFRFFIKTVCKNKSQVRYMRSIGSRNMRFTRCNCSDITDIYIKGVRNTRGIRTLKLLWHIKMYLMRR